MVKELAQKNPGTEAAVNRELTLIMEKRLRRLVNDCQGRITRKDACGTAVARIVWRSFINRTIEGCTDHDPSN